MNIRSRRTRKIPYEISISEDDFECLLAVAEYDREPSLSEWLRAALEQYSEMIYLMSDGETSQYIFKEPQINFGINSRRYVLYLDPIDIRNFETICGLLGFPIKGSLSRVCRMIIRNSYVECEGYM